MQDGCPQKTLCKQPRYRYNSPWQVCRRGACSLKEYRPFQSMSETASKCSGIRCRQFRPGEHLRPYICCYWTMTSPAELNEPISHRVIPDGCVDIIFDLHGSSYGEAASIVGTMTGPIFAELKGRVNYLAIRFLPGGFLHFFDHPVCHIADRIAPLEMISGRRERDLTERLIGEGHVESRIELLDGYFERLLMRSNRSDPAVRSALANILRHKGSIEVSRLSKDANCSQRQLSRKFKKWVGVGPKSFCRIICFQNVLRMLPACANLNLLSIALDGGYYDQSHFIHEFNCYYGLSPSEFLQR